MNTFAQYVGYAFMVLSAIAALCGVAWLTMNWVWDTQRNARQLAWLTRAVQHYKKIEASPYDKDPS